MPAAKKTVKKVAVKTTTKAKATAEAAPKAEKTVKSEKVESTLKIAMLDTEGKSAGLISLSEKVFGAKVNKVLMAQAVRVYLANQRLGTAETKTRGDITMTKAKWYRQKGTGRARHGAKSAPIFVKGGVAHGPHAHDYSLSMPTKMKQAALTSALSVQAKEGNIIVVSGLEKVSAKTKAMALSLAKVGNGKPNKTLVVMPEVVESVYKSARNITGVALLPATQLNTYAVLDAKKIIFMKDAVEKLEKMLVSEAKK